MNNLPIPVFSFLSTPTDSRLEQILALYRAAGWWQSVGTSDLSEVSGIIHGSHCFLVAAIQGPETGAEQIVGMGRSISDGVSDAYIQDVAVLPAFRGRGIAGQIIGRIIDRLKADGIGWIGLIAERNTHSLYLRQGFAPMADSTPMLYRLGIGN